ncbi:2-amino-4-hydroxy-6-hydroxymethyldihydropteridine diphosphokinase [Geobacter sulfurreducens]|uniref:2-amino-4-hydroxy-6- hydroxymethyldihydropteridine diphosphokinase n=1 Tax=Geobacter sulfurreducens TaxID=35554 RepID=UPI000DBAE3D9|nr:2-amino-4-hydroxy-6-hydroxymethyldihydropteridine diphosphokinase [Geobacter sulfurreducens]BBA71378.1 2-amino-4-hydroxy-6-hydroxymethyldihydropteridine pyrophosphokinase [Geobacter sulfurreducens]
MESNVFIALGSNMGDRELNLLRAVAEIGKLPETRITALSGFYETEPVGPVPEQPDFLNAVLRIETSLTPHRLLEELQRIETGLFGRRREVPQGPRSMDLDILLYGSLTVAVEGLVIPHPRLHQRRFVLVPLAEIAPDMIHPVQEKPVRELLASLPPGERVTKI